MNKKKKPEQDPHHITNNWWDLKKTAADLNVPVSVVLQAREILKTNRRDAVIDHIKTWTPITTKDGHPIALPPSTEQPKSIVQLKREVVYNKALMNAKRRYKGEPYSWPLETKIQILYAAVNAGIRIDLEGDGWIVPENKQEEIIEKRNAPTLSKGEFGILQKRPVPDEEAIEPTSMLPHGLQEKKVAYYIGRNGVETKSTDHSNEEELGKAVSEADYVKKTEQLSPEEVNNKYGDDLDVDKAKALTNALAGAEDEKFKFGEFIETGFIKANLIKGFDEQPSEVEKYKKFVYEIKEIQTWWSAFWRKPVKFRIEIIAKSFDLQATPVWYHANLGLQSHNRCEMELIQTVNSIK